MNVLENRYITQIIYCIKIDPDLNHGDLIFIQINDYFCALELIYKENDRLIYYTYCYLKNKSDYGLILKWDDNRSYISDEDIHYNHTHDFTSHLFNPFDSEDTYSIYGPEYKYSVTVYVEKPYYKIWLSKLLPIDIDVIGIIKFLIFKFN